MADDVVTSPTPKFEIMMRDILLWRRKKVALSTIFLSTAAWILLDVYEFNFVTVISWAAMSAVVLLFLWGNLLRLLSKDEPELSRLDVSEKFTGEAVRCCREVMEEMIRWMFRVGAESQWFVFARTVLGLAVLSYIANLLDFQTLLFLGCLTGFTVPVLWEKNKGRIRKLGDKLRERLKKAYDMAHQNIVARTKKLLTKEEKEKKTA